MHHRRRQALLVSCSACWALVSGDDAVRHSALRGFDEPITETAIEARGLVSTEGIPECKKSVQMRVELFPLPSNLSVVPAPPPRAVFSGRTKMKQLAASTTTPTTTHKSATSATLTFCLDRIFLELEYVVAAGTTVANSEIVCAHVSQEVSFFSKNRVGRTPTAESRFFASGSTVGQVAVDNADVLRILADGEACEFRMFTSGEELLVGQLSSNDKIFNHDVDNLHQHILQPLN